MSPSKIPPRHPIHDLFRGMLYHIDGRGVLAQSPIADYEAIGEGLFFVRYGVVFLGKPHLSIVPGLIAVDYGQFYSGEHAWSFLLNNSNLFPRADVIGYRNDGVDDMVVVKNLDLVYPFHILVYDSEEATKPALSIDGIIGSEPEAIAPRLMEFTPFYHSLEDFHEVQA